MTAESLGAPPIRDLAVQDATLRATVWALMEGRGAQHADLARAIGISDDTLWKRLKIDSAGRNPFTATEIAAIADYFSVDVSEIYNGLGGVFKSPTPTGEKRRARQGSNLRPTAYKFADPVLAERPLHAVPGRGRRPLSPVPASRQLPLLTVVQGGAAADARTAAVARPIAS